MSVLRMSGEEALVARLDAIPVALRAALVSEADRLGRALRERAGHPAATAGVSLAVESTADAVTVTLAMNGGHTARRHHAIRPKTARAFVASRHLRPRRFRRASTAHAGPAPLDAAFVAMGAEIRAGLEIAFRRALVR
jgi:hypothetical protein